MGKVAKAVSVVEKAINVVTFFAGIALLASAAMQFGEVSQKRIFDFVVGAFLVTYPMLENRLREIDRTLMMLTGFLGAKEAKKMLDELKIVKEAMAAHGTQTGDGAKAPEKNATTGAEAKG